MGSYAELLTAQLRDAHVVSLRQRYLDLIEEARLLKEKNEQSYFEETKQAYIEKQKKTKSASQKLRALGISGGQGDEAFDSIIADYQETMEKLKRKRDEYLQAYNREVEKQSRLMDNVVAEYNAQIALQDYNASQKGTSTRSGGSKTVKTSSAAATTRAPATSSQVVAPEIRNYISNNNLQPAPVQRRRTV